MNLNLKVAATAGIATALGLSLASVALAAQYHSPSPSWISYSPQPAAPAVSAETDRSADSVSPTPDSGTSTISKSAAANQDQRAAIASSEAAPIPPLPAVAATGVNQLGDSPVANSPFIHSEPHGVAPFPLLLNRAVQAYVDDFVDQPQGLKSAFQRSRPFLPEMIKVMKAQGIPDDLVYLTFAESDFSQRGKGPWQFTVGTAARFGLRVNKWVDERRDPILSTKAAAEYLAQLHDQADNDWRVALVAWNTGAGNLERYWSLQGANYTKFSDLLPRRTRQLLNRFMAVAFIAHNAHNYGIDEVSYSDAPAWTTHRFKGGTLLKSIAREFETSMSKLRQLNPALRADRVPPNERAYTIRIPLDEDASN